MGQLELRGLLRAASSGGETGLYGADRAINWREAAARATLTNGEALAGKSALVRVSSQFDSALALLELDGCASRVVVVPSDFKGEQLVSAVSQANVEAVICDDAEGDLCAAIPRFSVKAGLCEAPFRRPAISTEWVLPTSGTTGAPKLVAHRLEGLLGAIGARDADAPAPVWGTFYDIRRFGGLQIFLRAVTGGVSLVITEANEPLTRFIDRMAQLGVTHLSGTPSHWRRLLMSGEAARLSPHYVRLSGEIADRAVLDAVSSAYPKAKIVHAYASTEAGVGLEVSDGREGFPASYLEGLPGVDIRIVDGTLRLRSARTAERYIGAEKTTLRDEEGFVDTGDLVERVGDRVFFKGRLSGAINVGGLKIHPEEVERVINGHSAVRMSLVKARRNPITGNLIVADVVLREGLVSPESEHAVREEILSSCRARLGRHKAPVAISFVSALPLSPAGKLLRKEA